tara:strand:- start:133 stop:651 length:519 start_codon:yes stop_codon:yes gene_type:complete
MLFSLLIYGCDLKLSEPELNKPIKNIEDAKCLTYFSYNPQYNLCFEGGSLSCDNNLTFKKEKELCLKQMKFVFFEKRKNHLENNYSLNLTLQKENKKENNFKDIKEYTNNKFKENISSKQSKIYDNYYLFCFKNFQYAYCDNYTNLLNKLNRDLYTIFDDIEILLKQEYENY